MPESQNTVAGPKVYRERIKEPRKTYYVTYQPADGRFEHAHLQLTVTEQNFNAEEVCKILEQELEVWLKRFPVPLMADAWDLAEDGITNPNSKESILMGFVDGSGRIIRKWGMIQKSEFPLAQSETAYLARVYADVPFRPEGEVWKDGPKGWRAIVITANIIVLFMVVIPVLIEVVSWGIAWVGYLLSALSVTKGLYEIAKALHWVKPSKRKEREQDEERRMAHYFYHCERNPEAFNRLKAENLRRDAIERTQKEASEVRASKPNPVSSSA